MIPFPLRQRGPARRASRSSDDDRGFPATVYNGTPATLPNDVSPTNTGSVNFGQLTFVSYIKGGIIVATLIDGCALQKVQQGILFDRIESTTYVYCIVTDRVAWSVGRSVFHTSEPCKNGSAGRDAVRVGHSGGLRD